MSAATFDFIRALVITALTIFLAGALLWRSLRKSDEPARLVGRWLASGVVLAGMLFSVVPLVLRGDYSAVMAAPLAAVCGLAWAIIWRKSLLAWFTKPIDNLFMGGDEPPDPTAAYSKALAKRLKSQPLEAIAAIEAELQKFPGDPAGLNLLAEIYALDLRDLPQAQRAIYRLCNHPKQAPAVIAAALNALADWQLSVGQNPEAAREVLQNLADRYPGTPIALQAQQRIAHLQQPVEAQFSHAPAAIALTPAPRYEASRPAAASEALPDEEALAQEVGALELHLQQFPHDAEARESLARLYSEKLHQYDQAVAQLEILVSQPGHPAKQAVGWMHAMVGIQVRLMGDLAAGQATLKKIISQHPMSAFATQAENRLALLTTELPKPPIQTVQLGNYDQRLGLRRKD